MICNSWFRFGLPLGSALVVVVFLESTICAINWLFAAEHLLIHRSHEISTGSAILLVSLPLFFSATFALSCVGAAKANRTVLTIWLVLTTVFTILGCLSKLVSATNKGQWMDFFIESFYTWIAHTCLNLYKMRVVYHSILAIGHKHPLDPVGQGFKLILKFYQEITALAFRLLLTVDLVLLLKDGISQGVISFIRHRDLDDPENEGFGAIIVEEFVIRGLRIILTFVGIYLIVKSVPTNSEPLRSVLTEEIQLSKCNSVWTFYIASKGGQEVKFQYLKHWAFVYFGAIVASLCNGVYLIVIWNDKNEYLSWSYFITLVASLIFRSWTLYICLKLIEPYISSTIPYVLEPSHPEPPQEMQPAASTPAANPDPPVVNDLESNSPIHFQF